MYFDPGIFVLVGGRPRPKRTKQNPLVYSIITCIILEIELFTVLNFFAGAVKLKYLPAFHFVGGGGKLMHFLSY